MNVSAAQKSEGIVRGARFAWTGDGTAAVVACGFNPTWAELVNITDTVKYEKIAGMAANATLKSTGTPTFGIDTNSAITLNGDGTVTIPAAININGKAFVLIVG